MVLMPAPTALNLIVARTPEPLTATELLPPIARRCRPLLSGNGSEASISPPPPCARKSAKVVLQDADHIVLVRYRGLLGHQLLGVCDLESDLDLVTLPDLNALAGAANVEGERRAARTLAPGVDAITATATLSPPTGRRAKISQARKIRGAMLLSYPQRPGLPSVERRPYLDKSPERSYGNTVEIVPRAEYR